MRETKDLLFKLQQLDKEIDALQADAESIPGKKQHLEQDLRAAEEKVEKAKEESVELAKRRKEREVELEATGDKMAKFQSQLYQVKSNREYEALQHEISGLQEKSSGIEDEILELLERAEEVSKEALEAEAALKAEREKAQAEQADLDKHLGDVQGDIAVKDGERKLLVSDLDPMLLKRYERIRENKGGTAVTTVENGACGGCFRRIPPHEMQELKKDDRLITCEGCGRIIIWRWE
jgi:predicted  nucleic acid-binding Zn-ribbon protein